MRVVVLRAFATACLIDAAMGACKGTSETELFRKRSSFHPFLLRCLARCVNFPQAIGKRNPRT